MPKRSAVVAPVCACGACAAGVSTTRDLSIVRTRGASLHPAASHKHASAIPA
jgi:hypothetical protein